MKWIGLMQFACLLCLFVCAYSFVLFLQNGAVNDMPDDLTITIRPDDLKKRLIDHLERDPQVSWNIIKEDREKLNNSIDMFFDKLALKKSK